MTIQNIEFLILNYLYKNSPEGFKFPSILDLGYLKEKFNIGKEFDEAFNNLTQKNLIDNVNKGWSGVYYASITQEGRNFVKEKIKKGEMLRSQILIYLLENESLRKTTSYGNLQDIFQELIKEYSYNGPGVFIEIQHMINENILQISNKELNNDSVISIKQY